MSILLMTFLYLFQYSLNGCKREIRISVGNIFDGIETKDKENWNVVYLDLTIYENIIDQDTKKSFTSTYLYPLKDSKKISSDSITCFTHINFKFITFFDEISNLSKPQEHQKQVISSTQYKLDNINVFNNKCSYGDIEKEMVATNVVPCSSINEPFKVEKADIQRENIYNESFLNIFLTNQEKLYHKKLNPQKKVSFNPEEFWLDYEKNVVFIRRCVNMRKLFLLKEPSKINETEVSFISFENIDHEGNVISFGNRDDTKLILQMLKDRLESGVKQNYYSNSSNQKQQTSFISKEPIAVNNESGKLTSSIDYTCAYKYSPTGVHKFVENLNENHTEHKAFVFDPEFEIFVYSGDIQEWVLPKVIELLNNEYSEHKIRIRI